MNEFGLCEIKVPALETTLHAGFTLDRLEGYRGELPKAFGLKPGVQVEIRFEDDGEPVRSASIVR